MTPPAEERRLLSIGFFIRDPRAPKNYRPKGFEHRLTWTEREERDRIKAAALAAARAGGWPANPYLPSRVRLTIQTYGGKWDAGAFDTSTRDALEGVLYANDRIVANGPQLPAHDDGGPRRLEVFAELLDVRSPEEAAALELAATERKRKRLLAASKPKPQKRRTA